MEMPKPSRGTRLTLQIAGSLAATVAFGIAILTFVAEGEPTTSRVGWGLGFLVLTLVIAAAVWTLTNAQPGTPKRRQGEVMLVVGFVASALIGVWSIVLPALMLVAVIAAWMESRAAKTNK